MSNLFQYIKPSKSNFWAKIKGFKMNAKYFLKKCFYYSFQLEKALSTFKHADLNAILLCKRIDISTFIAFSVVDDIDANSFIHINKIVTRCNRCALVVSFVRLKCMQNFLCWINYSTAGEFPPHSIRIVPEIKKWTCYWFCIKRKMPSKIKWWKRLDDPF